MATIFDLAKKAGLTLEFNGEFFALFTAADIFPLIMTEDEDAVLHTICGLTAPVAGHC